MRYEERVPDKLFNDKGHYLGRPADFEDEIIIRRVNMARNIPEFTGNFELLEIGCGNGASILHFSKDFSYCTGVDIENTHKDEFERFKAEMNISNCDYLVMNIEQESLDKQFDRLISFEVIEHLSDDKNVSAYFNHLKSGGIAAFTVPNKWWIFETHGARLPLLPWNRVPFFSWLPRFLHERWSNARIYTKRRIRKLLTGAGFRVDKIKYVTAPLDVLKESKFKRFMLKYIFKGITTKIPFLATSLFIVAYKDKEK